MISFRIKKGIEAEEAWKTIEATGMTPLFSSEDEHGCIDIVVEENVSIFPLPNGVEGFLHLTNDIDWQSQWSLHAKNFNHGQLSFPLPNGSTVKLEPGPGFGDLSHPTTEIILGLVLKHVRPFQGFLDIGCGSGILAICAAALGAEPVWALDIDPRALQHAQHNAVLNGLEHKISCCLPEELNIPHNISKMAVMNMISSEQQIAWKNLCHLDIGQILTSGILQEQENEYLALTSSWGWKIEEKQEKDGWLGFNFVKSFA